MCTTYATRVNPYCPRITQIHHLIQCQKHGAIDCEQRQPQTNTTGQNSSSLQLEATPPEPRPRFLSIGKPLMTVTPGDMRVVRTLARARLTSGAHSSMILGFARRRCQSDDHYVGFFGYIFLDFRFSCGGSPHEDARFWYRRAPVIYQIRALTTLPLPHRRLVRNMPLEILSMNDLAGATLWTTIINEKPF